jgi:mRNA-degrading endonuclease RelE of RelBE toxin-antitoxin system
MKIVFLRQAHRFIKKADTPLKEKIRAEVLKIADNPKLGGALGGKLRDLRAHRFFFMKSQYRIAYQVRNDLIIVSVASRENFYRDLKS